MANKNGVFELKSGEVRCVITINCGNTGLTVMCHEGDDIECFLICEGELCGCGRTDLFEDNFAKKALELPQEVKKIFAGQFGIS